MAEFRTWIDIAAAPQAVFAHLVTNEGMTAWMGEEADLDPVPGGRFAMTIAGHPVRGEFVEVTPPHRVVVTWGFEGDAELPSGSSRVEFTLTGTASGTRVDLLHADLPDAGERGLADGWQHFLPRLALTATGAEPGPDTWRPLADPPPTWRDRRP